MKTLEETAEEFLIRQGCQRMCCNDPECNGVGDFFEDVQPKDLIEFAKWMQDKNKYSKEDMISFAHFYFQEEFNSSIQTSKPTDKIFKEWFEQFKKK